MNDDEFATHEWWQQYKETVNSDPEMNVRGHTNFDDNFYLDIGDERFLVEMQGGEVRHVAPNPTLNDQWAFGVEGDREAWEEFIQDTPPAFNHEIIASHYRSAVRNEAGHLQLRGDNKRIFQNLRPFQRVLDLMRVTHNQGGS